MGIEIFHLSHHGLSYIPAHAQSSDKVFGEYIMMGHTENNMPTYRDNFDNGKFSIWSCGHVWMVGYTKVITTLHSPLYSSPLIKSFSISLSPRSTRAYMFRLFFFGDAFCEFGLLAIFDC